MTWQGFFFIVLDMSIAQKTPGPIVTWKQQAHLRTDRKRKRIAEELDGRDAKMLCTYEEGLALLPLELIYEIFSYLDVWSVIAVAGVCRRWRQLALNPYMWRHVTIRAKSCAILSRVFKLALMGGHLESLVLACPGSAGMRVDLPLSEASLRTWFRAACVNLRSLRIENFNFLESRLPATGIFAALPLHSIESVVILCPNSSTRSMVLRQLAEVPSLQAVMSSLPQPKGTMIRLSKKKKEEGIGQKNR